MSGQDAGEQSQLVLTAHPLQRVGAFALAALATSADRTAPTELPAAGFERAVAEVTGDAVRAALVRDSKGANGFWLKASYSFFPNAPMNHPSNGKRSDAEVGDAVRRWRAAPDRDGWPAVDCVLCGRQAVGFFGKRDVALAESEAYRNSTPRGHEGMALCRPCLQSFYALPYGCRLTGGSSIALHSWDEDFLLDAITRQVDHNRTIAATGDAGKRQGEVREVVALTALRTHVRPMNASVDLLVFNNNNRGQLLEVHSLEQPLAEWLRRTQRLARRRRGFTALVKGHASASTPGLVALARNAFREPSRIVSAGLRRLLHLVGRAGGLDEAGDLAQLLYSFATEVMLMTEKDLSEIRAAAHNVATLLAVETSGGRLRTFRTLFREPRRLRGWLTGAGVQWAIKPPADIPVGPFVSERAFVLLFDPGQDNAAWFHRDVFLVAVLEELARRGWAPKDKDETDVSPSGDSPAGDWDLDALDQQAITYDMEEEQS
ncbi:hypothetical protein GCM10009665_39770 [Kitasatospora nipponensis]|uniref:CRISPR-associated protein Cst1 n=1 Tax=Kitasatospora nipponensis TaxID=258049 RepID=A0ABP4H035_9ACTN